MHTYTTNKRIAVTARKMEINIKITIKNKLEFLNSHILKSRTRKFQSSLYFNHLYIVVLQGQNFQSFFRRRASRLEKINTIYWQQLRMLN